MKVFKGLIAAWLLLASPIEAAGCKNTPPTATVRNGTYSGTCNSKYKQDFFLGMPFAQVSCSSPHDQTTQC